MRRVMLACALSLIGALPAAAQVTVAPTTLVITDRSRFGTFLVQNQSDEAHEISVGFRFGFPVLDATGEQRMLYGDTVPGAERLSLTEWVRAFPRQFVLGPREQQIIRLTVRPPADLEEGAYWTRIVTTSAPVSPQVDTLEGGVAAQVIFRLEQVTTLLYHAGAVSAGVELGEIRVGTQALRAAVIEAISAGDAPPAGEAEDMREAAARAVLARLPDPADVDTTAMHVVVPLRHTGNAPLLGTLELRISDERGEVVAEAAQGLSLYVDGVSTFSFDREMLAPGSYTAELRVTAERNDLPPEDRLPLEPVTSRVTFSVPE